MEGRTSAGAQTIALGHGTTGSRSDHVKAVFENSQHYLNARRVDILFRTETVKSFAGQIAWESLLDIGCGDGTISLSLLAQHKQLTLMDLSTGMTALASENVPKQFADDVDVRNENFMTASLDAAAFDLIVTVGVMAHVDSPDAFLAKIRQTLRPGGHLILEFTDSRHVVGRFGRALDRLKERFAPARYQTNKLSFETVAPLFEKHKLKLVSTFRYSRIPLPLLHRVLSPALQHKIARCLFQDAHNNTNASFGNEYLCLLKAEG